MAIVCMVSRKGGIGKTTLTLALADFLSTIHSRNVLVIDVDPQANASVNLLGEQEWKALDDSCRTLADVFAQAITPALPVTIDPNDFIYQVTRVKGASGAVHVVASSPRLQDVEDEAMETLPRWAAYAGSPYLILHRALSTRIVDSYDYVLIDCPPSMSLITMNALAISSGYLIPTIADYVSTAGLTQMTTKVKHHADGLRRKLPLYGTVVNRFKRAARLHNTMLAELQSRPEAQPVWSTVIPDTVRAEEALKQDAGVMTLKQRYGGSSDALYAPFAALATEFLQRIS